MIASLPMYDTETTHTTNDQLWAGIRGAYGRGPDELSRGGDLMQQWCDPALVLSQTCGLPYRAALHDKVTLVGTPDYGVRGCPPGYYKSYLIVRADDPRKRLAAFEDAVLARNSAHSQSGWAAIENHLVETRAGYSFAQHTIDTGSHAGSVSAVARGEADIAAIDAVTWTLLKRHHDEARACRVLGFTRPTPGLPFITARATDAAPLFDAIAQAIAGLTTRDRARLLLKGVVRIPSSAYLAEPIPPGPPSPTN